MRSNRSAETEPEKKLRRALWASGLRGYRKNVKKLPGKPDVVFTSAHVCVFVHGCFWHRCPRCKERRNLKPTRNGEYWQEKLDRNVERDLKTSGILEQAGWKVITLWECDLNENLSKCVEIVAAALGISSIQLERSKAG